MKSCFRLLLYLFLRMTPTTRWYRLRAFLWRLAGVNIHPSARVTSCVRFIAGDISIGPRTYVGQECLFTGTRIVVGADCDIAPRVIVHGGTHALGGPERRAGRCVPRDLVVGNGVRVDTGSILIAGVHVGDGAVIAAGSVVTEDVPPRVLVAGVPAVAKKQLSMEPQA